MRSIYMDQFLNTNDKTWEHPEPYRVLDHQGVNPVQQMKLRKVKKHVALGNDNVNNHI